MPQLGPLFGDDAIIGPVLVQYFSFVGVDVYLVGERHDRNGSVTEETAHLAVLERLKALAHARNTKRPVLCYCESSQAHAQQGLFKMGERAELTNKSILAVAKSPLYSYIAYKESGALRNVENCFADLRNISPYDIYTLITCPDLYRIEHHGIMADDAVRAKVRASAKLAEKTIMSHISTRADATRFLESFCLADRDYPEWFRDLYGKVSGSSTPMPSPLRDRMRRLRELSEEDYGRVVHYTRHLFGKWAVTPYTAAMARLESRRRTHNSKLVAEKDGFADSLFVELSAFLMDIFIIADILVRTREKKLQKGDTVVVFSGAKHTVNIGVFFRHQFGCDVSYKYDDRPDHQQDGHIFEGPAKRGPANLRNLLPSIIRRIRES
jgi:hypothetical protein